MAKYMRLDENGNLIVQLERRIDAVLAPEYMDEFKEYIGKKLRRLVLLAKETEYISSAGIRVVLFAKQKLAQDTELMLVAPQKFVLDAMELTGILPYLTVVDEFTE